MLLLLLLLPLPKGMTLSELLLPTKLELLLLLSSVELLLLCIGLFGRLLVALLLLSLIPNALQREERRKRSKLGAS